MRTQNTRPPLKHETRKAGKAIRFRVFGFFRVFVVILCLCSLSTAAIDWSGYLKTDNRILSKDWSFSYQEYRMSLQTDYKPNDNIHFFAETWLRSIGFPDISNSSDLGVKQKISPVELDLREAYVDFYQLFFRNLDVRIGRQRIAWGVADKLNPTDNLDPNDLEDIWDFGRHQASNSIKASFYLSDWSLTGVFIPTFTPAVLPGGDWAIALMPALNLPPGFSYRSITDTIIMPENKIKQNSIFGAKISNKIFNYDFSISYLYGRYDLPIINRITFAPTTTPLEVDIASQFAFPRTHIVGFDIAGAIKDIGVWAEAALYAPEKTVLTTDLTLLGMGLIDTVLLDKPYLRYIIGLDYTFKNGIYINGQFLHGFVHERGNGNLEDYFTLGMEWKLLQDKLKLSPLNSAIEIKEWQDMKNNYAVVLMPEMSYIPFSGTELTMGYRWLEGTSTTTFGRVKDNDEIYLKVKYSF